MPIARDQSAHCAHIYVTLKSMQTVESLVSLNDVDRDQLNTDPKTRLNDREGYYLCAESIRLAVLPDGAALACVLSPRTMEAYMCHVSFPPELRGVVFSGAPKLPQNYAAILGYWSPIKISTQHSGAQHCQNLLNEYAVREIDGYPQDSLLSNAVVMCMQNVSALIAGMSADQYLEVHIPVDTHMLGLDRAKFDSALPYDLNPEHACQRIYLKMSDILVSPNPDFIAIAVLHSENHDAEFYL